MEITKKTEKKGKQKQKENPRKPQTRKVKEKRETLQKNLRA